MVNIEDLPKEMLLEIFLRLPSWFLLRSCRLVCSRWRDMVDTLSTGWKEKCEQAGYPLGVLVGALPDWKTFYFLCRMKKNLIRNPCGEAGLNSWQIEPDQVEAWDVGKLSRDNSPFEDGTWCFGAFSGPRPKSQLIVLKDHGYWDELMDEVKPDIVVKDWCDVLDEDPYNYTLHMKLLSADSEVLCECRAEELVISEPGESEWREGSYTFHNYPTGVRYIYFEHGVVGVDSGSLTNSSITVGPRFP
nr:F-box only protein 44-like [Zootoca vivipara]